MNPVRYRHTHVAPIMVQHNGNGESEMTKRYIDITRRVNVYIPEHGTYSFHPGVFAEQWDNAAMFTLGHLQNEVIERATGMVPYPHHSNSYGKGEGYGPTLARYNTLTRFDCVAMLSEWVTGRLENEGVLKGRILTR